MIKVLFGVVTKQIKIIFVEEFVELGEEEQNKSIFEALKCF